MDRGGGTHAVLELFETAQVVAMTLDVDGRITWCNGYLSDLTGLTRDELVGRDFFATFEPERGPDAMRDLIGRVLAGDRETYGETVLVCNGTPRVIAWSDTIVRDEHGAIVGTTSIGQDVTDRRRAQTRLALQVEVAHVLASATTLEEAAHEVLAALVRAVNGCAGALWVVDRDVLRIGGTFALPDDPAADAIAATWRGAGAVRARGDGVAGHAWSEELLVRSDDRTVMAFPAVSADGEVLAVLELVSTVRLLSDPGEARAAAAIGFQVVSFLERLGREHELRELAEQLRASRARLVHTADTERRRLERNLHDGAQQRLVALSLALTMAERRLQDDPAAGAALVAQARTELAAALEDVRELARGLHPAILSAQGLAAALPMLASRAPIPVEIDAPPDRLPEHVEVALYYVVSEALANIAKYARASRVVVRVARAGAGVEVSIADDGVGGADAGRGTGLRGLADRIEALGGVLVVSSPPGEGTRLLAVVPLAELAG
jgi:PAS domain S-box-containing protein